MTQALWWRMVSWNRRQARVNKAMRHRRPRKGDCCYWCQRQLESSTSPSGLAVTRDHVKPKSRGGRRTVLCCRACNNLKGDMTVDEWKRFMEQNPKWWRQWRVRTWDG